MDGVSRAAVLPPSLAAVSASVPADAESVPVLAVPPVLDTPGSVRTPAGRPSRELVSPAEAAGILGIDRSTFDRKWKDGTLPALGVKEARRITWRRQFDRQSVERALWSRRFA